MTAASQEHVTRILAASRPVDPSAAEELLPLVYDQLRDLAHKRMAKEPAGQTLEPTALVHEAYLRLVGDQDVRWENRAHFFAAAAIAMRRILVERARKYAAAKHGGGRRRVTLDEAQIGIESQPDDLIALDQALIRLEAIDERKNRIVMLRYFAGLSIKETAKALALSPTTVKDEWSFAKAWLLKEIGRDDGRKS